MGSKMKLTPHAQEILALNAYAIEEREIRNALMETIGQLAALQLANKTLVEQWRAEAEELCNGYSLSAALAHHGLSPTDGMRVAVLDDLAGELEAATREATA